MAKQRFLQEDSLASLRVNIEANRERYGEDAPWLKAYFGGVGWFVESDIPDTGDLQLLPPASRTELCDLENTRRVYEALQHWAPVQASDPRLWAYMTHVSHWEYMRKRWPVERWSGVNLREKLQARYFVHGDQSRALLRNGMARLWWYGYCTHDEEREDPWELTGVLLKKLDLTQNLLENASGRNRSIMQAVLSVLLKREREGRPFYVREQVRALTGYLNQIGGVMVIDALEPEEIRALVEERIDQITATAWT